MAMGRIEDCDALHCEAPFVFLNRWCGSNTHSFLLEEPSLFRQTSKLAAKEEALRTLGHALLYFHTDLFFEFVHRHEQAYAFEAGTHSRLDRDHFISERLEFAAQMVLGTVMGDTFPNRKNGLQI